MRIRWDTESSRSYRVLKIVPSSTDYMSVSSVLVALHPVLPTGGTEIDILVLLYSCRLETRPPTPSPSYWWNGDRYLGPAYCWNGDRYLGPAVLMQVRET